MNATRVSRKLLAVAGALLFGGTALAQRHYYDLIHHFAGGANDGASPQGSLVVSGSTLYGMTLSGGPANAGTIFRINADGTGFALLHAFDGSNADGASPYGSLTLDGTLLYGMTYAGGSSGLGTVFKINTDGTGFTILHSFADGVADGAFPFGSLTLSGTVLYGMTSNAVFRINSNGTGFAVLHFFDGVDDGSDPHGSLTLWDNTLYGLTASGGGQFDPGAFFQPGFGTLFSVNTNGTGYQVLYRFKSRTGVDTPTNTPYGSLTLVGTWLYGMTARGGHGDHGAVFVVRPQVQELWRFSGGDGNSPRGTLLWSGDLLYGLTTTTAFQMNIDGTGGKVLHSFGGSGDGAMPYGDLTLSGATLYGMTSAGGAFDKGVLFALTPNAPVVAAQPTSQAVVGGGSATFTVASSGAAPFSYQWQRQAVGGTTWSNLSDGAVYSGTGTATLTVSSLTTAMSGDLFRCVVSNAYGDDTSAPAALVVPAPMTVTTFAGQGGHTGGSDGAGSAAQFFGPSDLGTDGAGNVYVADTYNNTIRKITPAGVVSTIAGYTGASGSADGTAAAARFNHPSGVTVDPAGNIFAADTDNHTIRKIAPTGAVTTLAGQAGASGSVDGTGSAARFNGPSGLAVDSGGNLYVADTLNHTVRKITPAGVVTTVAGAAGLAGSVDSTGTAARFFGPQGVSLDPWGNLYVADTNNSTIRKIALASGAVTTVAGLAGTIGSVDGPGSMARFNYPSAVFAYGSGDVFVVDTDNDVIRDISPQGVVSTIAGRAGAAGSVDGVGDAVRFNHPSGMLIDQGYGNFYVADTGNQTIRQGIYPSRPLISTQPQSQTVMAGSTVQFVVDILGKPTPNLQWYCNGVAIGGATGRTLTLTGVQSTNAGDYTVTATNTSGSITSNTATLTVNAVPAVYTASGGGGGGGGAMELWFVLGLLGLAAGRRMAADFRR